MGALEREVWLNQSFLQAEGKDFLLLHNSQFQESREEIRSFEVEESFRVLESVLQVHVLLQCR